MISAVGTPKLRQPLGSSFNNEIMEDGPSSRQLYAGTGSGKVRQKRYTARATNPYSRPATGRHAAAGPLAAAAVATANPGLGSGSGGDRKKRSGDENKKTQPGWLGGWGFGTIRNLVAWPWTALSASGSANKDVIQEPGAVKTGAGLLRESDAAAAAKADKDGDDTIDRTTPAMVQAGPSGVLSSLDFNAILRGEKEMTRDEAAFLKDWVEAKLKPAEEQTEAETGLLEEGAKFTEAGDFRGLGRRVEGSRTPLAAVHMTPSSGRQAARDEFYTPPGSVEDGPIFGEDLDDASPVDLAKAFMSDRLPQQTPPPITTRALTYYPDGARAGPPEASQNGTREETSRQLQLQIRGTPGEARQRGLAAATSGRGIGQIPAPAWTPYSRPGQWVEGIQPGVAVSRWTPMRAPLTGGREQTRKRRSSALDDGWASIGPIRRTRQRPILSQPGGASSQAVAQRAADLAAWDGEEGREQRRGEGARRLSMVPTQSAESARKILEALDRSFSPVERKQLSDEGLVKQTMSPEAMGKRAKRSMQTVEPPPRSSLEEEVRPAAVPSASQARAQGQAEATDKGAQQEGFPPFTPAQYRAASKAVEQAGLQETVTPGKGKGKEVEEEANQPRPAGVFGTTAGAFGGATAGRKWTPLGSEAASKEDGAVGGPSQANTPSGRGGFRMTAMFDDEGQAEEEARAGRAASTSGAAAAKPLAAAATSVPMFSFGTAGSRPSSAAAAAEARGGVTGGGFTFQGGAASETPSTPKLTRAGSGSASFFKGGVGVSGAATPTFEFGTSGASGQSGAAAGINFAASPGAQEKQAEAKQVPRFEFQNGKSSELPFGAVGALKEGTGPSANREETPGLAATSAAMPSLSSFGAQGTTAAAGTSGGATPGGTATSFFASATGATLSGTSASTLLGSAAAPSASPSPYSFAPGTVPPADSSPAGSKPTSSPLLFQPPTSGPAMPAAASDSGLLSFLAKKGKREGEAATEAGGTSPPGSVFGRLGPSGSIPDAANPGPDGSTAAAAPVSGGFTFGAALGTGGTSRSGFGPAAGQGTGAGSESARGAAIPGGLFGSGAGQGAFGAPATSPPATVSGAPAVEGAKPVTPLFGSAGPGAAGFLFGGTAAGGAPAGETSRREESEGRKTKRAAPGGEGGFGSAASSPAAGAALFGSASPASSGGFFALTTAAATSGSAPATSPTSAPATAPGTTSGPSPFSVPAFGQASASAPAGSASSPATSIFSFGAPSAGAGSSPAAVSGPAGSATGSGTGAAFGGGAVAAGTSNAPLFGAGVFGSSSAAPAFGTASASAPASAPGFGASSAPSFGSAAGGPVFGGLPGPGASQASFSGFGSSANQGSNAPSAFTFGAASGGTPSPTSGSAPSSAAPGGFPFGGPPSPSTPTPGGGGFVFGGTGAAATGMFSFGAKAGPSSPGGVFGGFGAASSAPAFGSGTNGPTNQEAANGSPNGMEDSMAEEPFSPPKPAAPTAMFGSPTPQPAGQSPFMFGQSPPGGSLSPSGGGAFAFGAQPPAQPPVNPFGAPAQPQPSPFGAPPAQQGGGFGGTAAAQGQMLFNVGGGDKAATPGGRRLVKAKRPGGGRKR